MGFVPNTSPSSIQLSKRIVGDEDPCMTEMLWPPFLVFFGAKGKNKKNKEKKPFLRG